MKKVILYIILIFSNAISSYSQKKIELIQKIDILQNNINLLNGANTDLKYKIESVTADNRLLSNKIDSLQRLNNEYKIKLDTIIQKYNELNQFASKFTKTPGYFYKNGIEEFNQGNFTTSYKIFSNIIQSFPDDINAKYSQLQINLLNQKSLMNYNEILSKNSKLTIGEKISNLSNANTKYYLNQQDSIKIASLLDKLNLEFQSEKFVIEKNDPLQSCKFYQSSRDIEYITGSQTYEVSIYIVKNYNGTKYFRLKTDYSGKDWIFYERVIIRGDNGIQINIQCTYPEKKSDNGSYSVNEWSDNYIQKNDENKILSIANSNEITVRFIGQYSKTFDMTEEQIKAFKEIVLKFKKI